MTQYRTAPPQSPNPPRPPIPAAARAAEAERTTPCILSASPFRLPGSRTTRADVEIEVAGFRFRVLVRSGRVVYPFLLGTHAVHIGEPDLRNRVESAAVNAAREVQA